MFIFVYNFYDDKYVVLLYRNNAEIIKFLYNSISTARKPDT